MYYNALNNEKPENEKLHSEYNLYVTKEKWKHFKKYDTMKAMEGLFKLIAKEEKKIRTDPIAQVTDLLKKVFGKQ